MKKWRKVLAVMLAVLMVLSVTACSQDTPTSSASKESSGTSDVSEPADSSEPESSTPEEGSTGTDLNTPREETVYFGGRQWGKPNNMNPLSPNPNLFGMSQTDFPDEQMYETLYMYNLLTNEIYPLLADGDIEWNADNTVATVKINPDAKWSDGTAVTVEDVKATFDTHVKYQSTTGVDYAQYIESVTVNGDAAEFKCVSTELYNPLKVKQYLANTFVMQKAYIDTLAAEVNDDAAEFKQAPMWDAPTTGPYKITLYDSEQKVIYERDDNYWGQAESLWGGLAVPKYLVHNMYADNAATAVAFKAGEIDVSQSFMSNLQNLWLDDGLPISTYLDDAPYQISGGMPSLFLNQNIEVLQVKEIRQAIAYAINYDQIVDAAMTGQSPTFADYPRSLFNPADGEQSLIRDQAALDEYRWDNQDIERANKVLDDAGILDTDGDGIREYNGENITLKIQCPNGWTDWMAAVQIAADAGKDIGLGLESYYPEAAQNTEDLTTGNFDIAMYSVAAAGIASPWARAYQFMYGYGGEFPETMNMNYGRWYNAEAEEILAQIPVETDEAKLQELWERLNIIYLDEVPSIALLYRPSLFHEVNETIWTNYPTAEGNEGRDIPVPPQNCVSGYGIAGLYELELVG